MHALRTLLLSSSFPRWPGDGSAHFMGRYAEALDLPGVALVPSGPERRTSATWGALDVTRFQYWWPARGQALTGAAGMPDNLRRAPWRSLQLPALLAAWTSAAVTAARDCEVIDAHWAAPAGLVGLAASRRSGRPLRLVLHSGDVHVLGRWPGGRRLALALARGSAAVTATSCYLRERFIGLLPPGARASARTRMSVLSMGVDLPGEQPHAAPHDDEPRALRRVAFLGRLVPVKGLCDLVDALAGMPRVLLEVAGEGPERAALEARARRHGVHATFHGQLVGQAKQDLFARADAVVLPSRVLPGGRTESLPVVLLEALAAGRPVIATRVGGVPEVIDDLRNGRLVEPACPPALRRALDDVLANRTAAEALARAARETARRFSWERLGPAHREVLAVAARGARP